MSSPSSADVVAAVILDLLDQVDLGEIGILVGEELAAERFDSRDRMALAKLALDIARDAHHGEGWRGYLGERLVYAATRGMPSPADSEGVRLCGRIAGHCLAVATVLLREAGYTGVHRWACKVANETLLLPLTDETRGLLHYQYGILFLDPYFAMRDANWHRLGIALWREAAKDRDRSEASLPDVGQDGGLPSPGEALGLAERHLRKASLLAVGITRRDALKALAQSIESRRMLDLPVDRETLVEVCDEALATLREFPDATRQEYVTIVRSRAKREMGSAEDVELDQRSPEELLAEYGPVLAVDRALAHISALAQTDLSAALLFAAQARPLFSVEADEGAWQTLRTAELNILVALGKPRLPAGEEPASPEDALRIIQERYEGKYERAACMVALAAQTAEDNEESLGLEIMDLVFSHLSDFAHRFEDSLRWFQATLHAGVGANAANARQWRESADAYCRALRFMLGLGLSSPASNILAQLLDVVQHLDGKSAGALASALDAIALYVDRRSGETARATLTSIGLAGLRVAHGEQTEKSLAIQWMAALVKGRKTRAWLNSPRVLEMGEEARQILRRIGEKERAAGIQAAGSNEAEFGTQLLVAASARSPSATGGRDQSEQLSRLRQEFDRSLVEGRLDALPELEMPPWRPDDVVQAIGAESVVLDLCRVKDAQGALTIGLAYTAEEFAVFSVDDRSELTEVSIDDRRQTADLSGLGLYVAGARSALLEPSGLMNLPRNARDIYENGLLKFVGNGVEYLDRLRRQRGKTHLCIVPHGPLHLFPFHAVGPMDRPLADDWMVTYLPNLAYLTRDRPRFERRAGRGVALGIGYRGHPFLSELEAAESETRAVANALSSVPIIDDAVTKDQVIQALRTGDVVHLACHGSYCPEAPLYQCLYLSGDTLQSRLFAYELLGEDLRHLQIVTLSACETALSGFDEADDLRGIQSSLLQSGVGAIVDTLWEVSSEVAPVFFGTFYERLAAGDSKLEAFARAQRTARERFPTYRDWAAFRFSGDWR